MLTPFSIIQLSFFLFILILTVKPLGWYIAQVYAGRFSQPNHFTYRFERFVYRICYIQPQQAMDWKTYLIAMLVFNLLGLCVVYLILRLQSYLPFNPQHFSGIAPYLALNTAVSFVTNTNWQAYSGETSMSYATQMLAFTTQNFLSAATGMALLVALSRGVVQHTTKALGNFWVDMVRGTLFILLPLSLILAIILMSQGVIQNFNNYQAINLIEPLNYQQPVLDIYGHAVKNTSDQPILATSSIKQQILPMGPAASQIAIKQLGTNGGGFFNTNSAHPFENPTAITNFVETLAILLIPAALCYSYGIWINDRRQGWALLVAMLILFIPFMVLETTIEQIGNPALRYLNIAQNASADYPGGNLEGKESRFGITSSALWTVSTTAAANGSVNSMLDSYMPLGGLIPLWMMHLGEVIFGGIGSGLYTLLILVIITVFIAGLMVGRTPEYMGKKIEPYEMKMAAIAILIMPLIVLLFTSIAVVVTAGVNAIANPGPHGFSEILYAFTSMGNNNGSAFAGLNVNNPLYNLLGALAMLISRYWIAIPVLAIAGSLAQKKIIPQSPGTLATHTPLFILLLIAVMILIGALAFFPALSLGPIIEHLLLWDQHA